MRSLGSMLSLLESAMIALMQLFAIDGCVGPYLRVMFDTFVCTLEGFENPSKSEI